MKFFLIIVVFLCCVLIGFFIKNHFLKRQRFFEDLIKFIEDIVNEISFKNEKLNLIVEKNLDIFCEPLNYSLNLFKNYLDNTMSANELKFALRTKLNFLNEEEIKLFVNFLFSLGGQTKDEEINKLLINKTKLITIYDEAKNKNGKYSSLYFKLFFVLGLTISILFL